MEAEQQIDSSLNSSHSESHPAKTARLLLRLIRASQPISRVELAQRLEVNRSTITEICKPLLADKKLREETLPSSGGYRLQGRPRTGLRFAAEDVLLIGASIGVKTIQVGISDLSNKVLREKEFVTPENPNLALDSIKSAIKEFCAAAPHFRFKTIGVSVCGVTDSDRRNLLYAPHLGWRNVDIAGALKFYDQANKRAVPVVVENDATAAAIYEARVRMGKSSDGLLNDFILIRSGTGIGVGLVLEGEVFRGTGTAQGYAGEFGHMTIVAGGKPCVCGNRGCWERYAAAASAVPAYLNDHPSGGEQNVLRFLDVVKKAEADEIKALEALENLGEYLGIGIANVFSGVGIPRVIISGRLVYGWKFIKPSLFKAVEKSMAGKIKDWRVEPGEPHGAGLGGALEVAFEEYILRG